MKTPYTLLLLISLLFLRPSHLLAQVEQSQDSLEYREKFGLRVGIDLSKPIRSFIDKDYQGLEINGDYRIYDDYYLAAEIGNEQNLMAQENITAFYKGSYIKLGANYNVYNNWQGMQNLIFVGLRYGFSTFSSELREYTVYDRNNYFEPDIRTDSEEFSNLTAGWLELQLGVKVEVLNNLYLGAHVELKRRINETSPNFFDNLYIPGFGRTYDDSSIGAGYGYSISYLIPLYRK